MCCCIWLCRIEKKTTKQAETFPPYCETGVEKDNATSQPSRPSSALFLMCWKQGAFACTRHIDSESCRQPRALFSGAYWTSIFTERLCNAGKSPHFCRARLCCHTWGLFSQYSHGVLCSLHPGPSVDPCSDASLHGRRAVPRSGVVLVYRAVPGGPRAGGGPVEVPDGHTAQPEARPAPPPGRRGSSIRPWKHLKSFSSPILVRSASAILSFSHQNNLFCFTK